MRSFTRVFLSIAFVAFVAVSSASAASPVVPATPTITVWSDWTEGDEPCHNIVNTIPTVDKNGKNLNINNLHYMVWLKSGDVAKPYYFSTDHYSLSSYTKTNGLEEIPYGAALYNDDIQYGASSVVLYSEIPVVVVWRKVLT